MEGVFVFSVIRVLGSSHAYAYPYNYDDLYRLSSSDGNGAIDASYTLAMEYSPSGNILKKTMAATKEVLGNGTFESYDNEYSYNGAHTLGHLTDLQGGALGLTFNFDGNGNMVTQQLYNDNSGLNERYLCWDEENRLSATRDNNYVTANIYDASGNRSWKLAGEMNWMWQNGVGWQGYGDLTLRRSSAPGVLFQSELMTITDVGITKHYFIAGQRIASKIAESLSSNDDSHSLKEKPLEPLNGSYEILGSEVSQRLWRDFDCLGVNYSNFGQGETVLRILDELNGAEQVREDYIYFYHSDHLVSSSFLTDINGYATQHLQCMPFGEDLVHQQNTAAYYTPYTFSGKERDMETGLSYFGARYYDAGLSIWLSVDPMADKYPSLSAYNYCAWNPVMLVDPDGKDIELTGEALEIHNKLYNKTEMRAGFLGLGKVKERTNHSYNAEYAEKYDVIAADHSVLVRGGARSGDESGGALTPGGYDDLNRLILAISYLNPNGTHGGTATHIFVEELYHAFQNSTQVDVNPATGRKPVVGGSIRNEVEAKEFAAKVGGRYNHNFELPDGRNRPTEMSVMSGRGNYNKAKYLKEGIELETFILNNGRRESSIPYKNAPPYPTYP